MRILSAILVGLMSLNGASCSDSNFAGTNLGAKPKEEDAKKGDKKGVKPGEGGGEEDTLGNGSKSGVHDPKNDDDLRIEIEDDGSVKESFKGLLTEKAVDLDIVFAMDTSGSMSSEKTRLEASMSSFMTQFREKAKAINFKVYMIGSNFKFPAPDANLVLVNIGVGSNDALKKIRGWVTGDGATKLRTAAAKHFVVVTDDNAHTENAATFTTFIASNEQLKDKTSMHGLIGLKGGNVNSWCGIAAVGTEYQTLAASTKGTIFDLCQENWNDLLNKLAEAIIVKEAQREFTLSHSVADPLKIVVSVNGNALTADKWQYDPTANKLNIKAESAPRDGDTLEVQYKKR